MKHYLLRSKQIRSGRISSNIDGADKIFAICKGGWIQNRANTLALWCMFAQVFPLFQDRSIFTTLPVLYADGFMDAAIRPTLVNPVPQGVISIASLAINVLALALIIKRSKEQKKNPYKQEIFTDAKDFQLAMARAEDK